jgi:Fe-S-cluster-containing hydrogenase component 2
LDSELELPVADKTKIITSFYDEKVRHENKKLSSEERIKDLQTEIEFALSEEELIDETRRCMSCGYCFDCGTCWSICQDQVIHKPLTRFQLYTFKLELCKGCFKCVEACPCGFIEMKNPLTGELTPRDEEGKVIYQT